MLIFHPIISRIYQYYIPLEYRIANESYKYLTKVLERIYSVVYVFIMKPIQQYKVAEWLGVSPSTLANIFCGNRGVSKSMAMKLKSSSGISFSDWMLLDGKELRKKVFISYAFHVQQSPEEESK